MTVKIVLQDAFKKVTHDQDKIMTPEETVDRFKTKTAHLNLDILESTERIDNGRLDIPVYFSICGEDAKKLTGTNKQMGKGATPAQSEASAVMELAERFSFFSFRQNENNFIQDTYKNVRDKAIDFDQIARSVHDYNQEELKVTQEFFSDLPLKWTWAYNITQKKEVLIPFDWFFMINEFNGPSAGNCQEEAICQGISEIIERHVSSLISMEKRSVPRIDPYTAKDPAVLDMLEKYSKAGIRLVVSDFSLDTGIPTVGVLAWDPSTFPDKSEIVWTAGTAPNPEKALSRALTEVAQLAGDFNTKSNYVASGLPKFRSLSDAGYIIETPRTISMADLPDLSHDNIRVEVENNLSVLEKKGMDVFLVNTMHPDLQVPAFYAIIPGAHFRERATGTNVGMFSAKFISENLEPFEALPRLKDMDKKLPGKYYIQFFIGLTYLSMERHQQALACFEKALSLEPQPQDIPSICSYTGVCLKDLGHYKEALLILEKGAEADDEREDIFNLMGFCHFMLKNHETAITCFKRVLELNPGSGIDYANIASNYRDMGETLKAISYYTMALKLDPSLDFARDNLDKLSKS
ncbi:MAG: YcaO-like family protein [Proteobacteria bacterium]|nr:YcaO-like family protein [Pseudomonadota bacterium]